MTRSLLVLDDDRERLRGFEGILPHLGNDWILHSWRNAPSMRAQVDALLAEAELISLDHDLYRDAATDPDPGTGRIIADLLAEKDPVCPVIVHSTNTDAAWGMFNALASGRWTVELVHHTNQAEWIAALWLPVAKRLLRSGGGEKRR